jgi:hypothetical protein
MGGLVLDDTLSKGRITVECAGGILHISSRNPYDRLTNDYRVFSKREGTLIQTLLAGPTKPIPFTGPTTSTSVHTPPTKKTARLSWKNNSNNADGFRIYQIIGEQKTKIAELRANVTNYMDKNAPLKACYIVTAFNAAGESPATSTVCLPE